MDEDDRHFKCAQCGNVYEKEESKKEAAVAKFKQEFPGEDFDGDNAIVCDECFYVLFPDGTAAS